MRLTVRLDEDVYSVALALAQSERISVAEAINRLVRRAVYTRSSSPNDARRKKARSGFPTSAGKRLITARDVEQIEAEEDERALGGRQ
jgi:hypothetical protein